MAQFIHIVGGQPQNISIEDLKHIYPNIEYFVSPEIAQDPGFQQQIVLPSATRWQHVKRDLGHPTLTQQLILTSADPQTLVTDNGRQLILDSSHVLGFAGSNNVGHNPQQQQQRPPPYVIPEEAMEGFNSAQPVYYTQESPPDHIVLHAQQSHIVEQQVQAQAQAQQAAAILRQQQQQQQHIHQQQSQHHVLSPPQQPQQQNLTVVHQPQHPSIVASQQSQLLHQQQTQINHQSMINQQHQQHQQRAMYESRVYEHQTVLQTSPPPQHNNVIQQPPVRVPQVTQQVQPVQQIRQVVSEPPIRMNTNLQHQYTQRIIPNQTHQQHQRLLNPQQVQQQRLINQQNSQQVRMMQQQQQQQHQTTHQHQQQQSTQHQPQNTHLQQQNPQHQQQNVQHQQQNTQLQQQNMQHQQQNTQHQPQNTQHQPQNTQHQPQNTQHQQQNTQHQQPNAHQQQPVQLRQQHPQSQIRMMQRGPNQVRMQQVFPVQRRTQSPRPQRGGLSSSGRERMTAPHQQIQRGVTQTQIQTVSPQPSDQTQQHLHQQQAINLGMLSSAQQPVIEHQQPTQNNNRQTPDPPSVIVTQQLKKHQNQQYNNNIDLEDSIQAAVLQKTTINNQPSVVNTNSPMAQHVINNQQETRLPQPYANEMGDGVHNFIPNQHQQHMQTPNQQNANSSYDSGTYDQQSYSDSGNSLYEQSPQMDANKQNEQEYGKMTTGNVPMSDSQRYQINTPNKPAPNPRSYNNRARGNGASRNRVAVKKNQTLQQNQPLQQNHNMHIGQGDGIEGGEINEQQRDSARMLVILKNGEQRLITFTLPKETCTVQDLLDQVGIPFSHDTGIQCVTNPGGEIDYVVTVGDTSEKNVDLDTTLCRPQNPDLSNIQIGQAHIHELQATQLCQADSTNSPQAVTSPDKPKSPEPPKEIPARFIPGMLALCKFCGYTGMDFNKCQRCKRKFNEEPKMIPLGIKKEIKEPKKIERLINIKDNLVKESLIKDLNRPQPTPILKRGRKVKGKYADPEPEVLTLSSDEEGGEKESQGVLTDVRNALICEKEPIITDDMYDPVINMIREPIDESCGLYTTFECRTIRIGSYKYAPTEKVLITPNGIRIIAPHTVNTGSSHSLHIQTCDIIKILVHLQKSLPVLFLYLYPSVGKYVRDILGMTENGGVYFHPASRHESCKRITLLPENVTEEAKVALKKIYGRPCELLYDLNGKEANDILVRTSPQDKAPSPGGGKNINSGGTDIRKILIYPTNSRYGISINTEDYICLAQDQFLNDVIIDFYLKYLCNEMIGEELNRKTYVFSSFFYKRLTLKNTKRDKLSENEKLTPAQKRHARVKSWTKNINIFDKDFIVIPINENAHWFLAIICFPGCQGPRTMIGDRPVDYKDLTIYGRRKAKKEKAMEITIGATTITPVKPSDNPIKLELGECAEERDEAEGVDSDLEMSSESDQEEPNMPAETKPLPQPVGPKEPVKQPCILIFDSLAGGTSRSRVVATLRDYLTCELQSKTGTTNTFNKDNIKGACPRVPQQNNFTDCGLYLLQYVEQFFKDPIKDYRLPIKQLALWFEEIVVTRKREDISFLIKKLVHDYNADNLPLPDIPFPTLNGVLVETDNEMNALDQAEEYDEEEMDEELEEEMAEDEEDEELYREMTESNNVSLSEELLMKLKKGMPTKSVVNQKRNFDHLQTPVKTSSARKNPKLSGGKKVTKKNNIIDQSSAASLSAPPIIKSLTDGVLSLTYIKPKPKRAVKKKNSLVTEKSKVN